MSRQVQKSTMFAVAFAIWAVLLLPWDGVAADPGPEEQNLYVAASLYAWTAGVDGDLRIAPGDRQHFDRGFFDTLEHIDFSGMARGNARWKRWVMYADLVYSDQTERSPLDPKYRPYDIVRAKTELALATVAGGYRVFSTGHSFIDILAGVRVLYLDVESQLRESTGAFPTIPDENENTVADPILMVRENVRIWRGLSLEILFDIGGFGVGSDFSYEFFGGMRYPLPQWSTNLFLGYRHLSIDYDSEAFTYDFENSGMVFGVEYEIGRPND